METGRMQTIKVIFSTSKVLLVDFNSQIIWKMSRKYHSLKNVNKGYFQIQLKYLSDG